MRRDFRMNVDRLQAKRRRRGRRRKARKLQPMLAFLPYRGYGGKTAVVTAWKRKHARRASWNWGHPSKLKVPKKKVQGVKWWDEDYEEDED